MARRAKTTSAPHVVVGPFVLESRIGEGGMGEVWQGRHVSQGIPVAVKVLTVEGSSRAMFVDSFRNEVRAVAALEHPHIVQVHDYGSVSDQSASRSGGRLVAGTPYLSMELVRGGTLADHMGALPWPEIERILRVLLDALAHAHARGVIHRDLKLANILYDPVTGTVKLTDFGIAHAMATTADPFRWGTPAYMPPEQLLGRWWDYGPWTDLYGLACCAVALITGSRAFSNDVSSVETRRLAPLLPRMPIPSGLEEWLHRLTDPDPEHRFRLAADAAWALQRMGRRMVTESVVSEQPASEFPEYTVALPFLDKQVTLSKRGSTSPFDDEVPPMPEQWEPGGERPSNPVLRGAGLGLVGLRRPPLVGRMAERTALWGWLREVRDTGEGQVVLVRGGAGCGKSRLTDWLAERAHEVGAAWVMKASHAPGDDGTRALGDMVARHLRVSGLGVDKIRERVRVALPEDSPDADVDGLVALIEPEAPRVTALPGGELRRVLKRLLVHRAATRPGVVILDDAQWGRASLELAATLTERVLVVVVASDQALAEERRSQEMIAEMMAVRRGHELILGPLSPPAHRELLHALLGLDGSLVRLVEDRTAGNPLFAVQLVGDWVERQVLEAGAHGFALRDGVEAPLPDDLYAVWSARIDDVLRERESKDRQALEIAALLGPRVRRDEWLGACRARGFVPSDDLVPTLLDRRLASLDGGVKGAWWFAHSMLLETLERQADEAGRAPSHHRACAAMLEASGRPAHARMARHLLHAGAGERAMGAAVGAIEAALAAGEMDRADGLVDAWTQAISSLMLREGDARWAVGLAACARVHLQRGRHDDVHGICRALVAGVAQHAWAPRWSAWASLWQGILAARDGRLAVAAGHFDAVPQMPEVAARTALAKGHALRWSGALAGAAAQFQHGLAIAIDQGDGVLVGDAWMGVAEVSRFEGDLDSARNAAIQARDAYRDAGFGPGATEVAAVMAGVARAEGAWEEARAMAHGAQQQWAGRGALVRALRAQVAAGVAAMWLPATDPTPWDALRAESRRMGLRLVETVVVLARVASMATAPQAEEALTGAIALLDAHHAVSPDLAATAVRVSEVAAARGWSVVEERAREVAVAQWMRLGRGGDASRLLPPA